MAYLSALEMSIERTIKRYTNVLQFACFVIE